MILHKKKLKIRERIYKRFFLTADRYKLFVNLLSSLCKFLITVTFLLFLLAFVFYIGFSHSPDNLAGLKSSFRAMFLVIFLSRYIPVLLNYNPGKGISLFFRISVFLFVLCIFLANFSITGFGRTTLLFLKGNVQVITAIFLLGILEASGLMKTISSVRIPPALIFSTSFLIIIFIGSGLLLLPNAHTGELTWLDSLFTSVSAVCVTGLVVVDTATAFTTLGKIIILSLIQIGGLGIMTFTGFFSYLFSSMSSFRNNLLLKELFSSESMTNLFKLLAKIILFTFLIELTGALIIYRSLEPMQGEKILFSVFHSVSAFCNAGFSTVQGNLFSKDVRLNETLQISIAVLIILGGIGFPVLTGFYSDLKYLIKTLGRRIQGKLKPVKPVNKNVSTRIVVFMTFILVAGGTMLYYFFESDGSLAGIDARQRIVTSFFGSVSARTAGFNIIDMTRWGYPTVFLMILLMWIGASPGSTGGGIKTTTFALAIRTAWNQLRGKENLRIGNREISNSTILRVLSIILLSMLLIGAGFFVLLLSEPGKNPVWLLFECFSAYGTVGLSLADSATFSVTGKIVDIVLMFIGRVGPLTLFSGFLMSMKKGFARYPVVEISIN